MTTPPTDAHEAARAFLLAHPKHVGLTLLHPLAALLTEREASLRAERDQWREACEKMLPAETQRALEHERDEALARAEQYDEQAAATIRGLQAQIAALASTQAAASAWEERVVARAVAGPYHERNMLVGALSKMFPAWLRVDPNDPDWPVVMIQLPTGQVSWHITMQQRYSIFSHLEAGTTEWDGHDDTEKWRRVCTLAAAIRAGEGK